MPHLPPRVDLIFSESLPLEDGEEFLPDRDRVLPLWLFLLPDPLGFDPVPRVRSLFLFELLLRPVDPVVDELPV